MSVVNGALANQTTFNNAFMSRTAPTTSTTSQVQLQNAGSTQVDDVQQFLKDISDSLGMAENDSNRDNYSSNNYVADGDDRKTAIGKLDTQLASTQSDLDDLEALNTQDISLAGFGSTPNAQGASLSGQQLNLQPASDTFPGGVSTTAQSFAGNKTFTGNVIVNGDFMILGTNFSAEVTNMEVEDQNILVNKGGNDATAEGAGIDVKRTATDAAIRFDSSLTSKWSLGLVGSLYEVMVSGVAQTISGLKTFSNGIATDTVAEKTSAAGVTIDGVLLKDGLTDGRDVSADGSTLDGHVANTSNPHSVTKAQVGLGNVTNDAQLTRAAGDFATFTEKTAPVGDDIVLLEDSADSGNKKKAKLSNLGIGGGSGVGGVNYITNYSAEVGTTGWAAYADAAGTSPVDGTGGSPNVTWTRDTGSPLRGTGSFLFTKDAANRQGQGASYAFTIDAADKAKVLKIEFDYMVASGTFVAGSPSTSSDLTVWIYDVTNSTLIQPSSFKLFSNSSTSADRFSGYFQTPSNSTSYRLIIHVGSTSASAYTVLFDNVIVGPSQYVYGTPITDWKVGTGYTSGVTTNVSTAILERRVGDTLEGQVRWSFSGAATGGESLNVTMPYTADINKLVFKANNEAEIGDGAYLDNGVNAYYGYNVVVVSSSPTIIRMQAQSQSSSNQVANAQLTNGGLPTTPGNTDSVRMRFAVPISGWSSSVQMSDNADTRLVDFAVQTNSPTGTIGANFAGATAVVYGSGVLKDSHAAYSTSTGAFTVPVAGDYKVYGGLAIVGTEAADNFVQVSVAVNGTETFLDFARVAASGLTSSPVNFNFLLTNLKAGDAITIRGISSITSPTIASSGANKLFIERVSGPSAIGATETIAAVYTNTAGTSIPNNSVTVLDYSTKTVDTHNAVTTGSGWKFTAPAAGKYMVSAYANYTANTTGYRSVFIRKNSNTIFQFLTSAAAALIDHSVGGVTIVDLLAGDTLDVQAFQNSGGALTLTTNTGRNVISINRIGL